LKDKSCFLKYLIYLTLFLLPLSLTQLLDEATSALDSASEFLVNSAISRIIAKGQITVWIVAHRLSTIKSAGTILVLDEGRVVETGIFDELDREGTRFRKLMAAQLEASGGTMVMEEEPQTETEVSLGQRATYTFERHQIGF